MERWQNKVAVVTGASSGIGAASCKALVAQGMIVVGLARRLERMEKDLKQSLPAEQQKRFHAIQCDISKEDDIKKAFAWVEQHLGGVDVLLNNAAVLQNTQIVAENNTAQLKSILDTNVMGVALCTREAFQSMKKRSVDGHVLIINSVAGHSLPIIPGKSFNMYPCSKFAITAMTEVLRQEFMLNQTKIKVTSISPGAVDTEMIADAKSWGIEFPMLRPEDIANAVVFCIQTPPHMQIHEMIIKPVGEPF